MAQDAGAPRPDARPERREDIRSGLSDIEDDPARTPGRVDAGEAVTGTRAGSEGEARPGGIPGDDSSLEGGNPA